MFLFYLKEIKHTFATLPGWGHTECPTALSVLLGPTRSCDCIPTGPKGWRCLSLCTWLAGRYSYLRKQMLLRSFLSGFSSLSELLLGERI